MTQLAQTQKTRSLLMSTRLFDEGTIIEVDGEDAGFPVENLQDIQPKRKWHHTEFAQVITHFIVDLGTDIGSRIYNAFGAMFHNAPSDPGTNLWRIRTGTTTTGTGEYDSGFIPLWPFSPAPSQNSFRSAEFYQTRGRGAHSFHILPPSTTVDEFPLYLHFEGGGQVNFGDILDPGDSLAVLCRVRIDTGQPPWTAMTIVQKGIGNIQSGTGTGFSLGLERKGQAVGVTATINDGTTAFVLDSFDAEGIFLLDDWNEIDMRWTAGGNLTLRINGQLAGLNANTSVAIPDTADPLRMGVNSSGIQAANLVDVERLVIGDEPTTQQEIDDWEAYMDADLRTTTAPSNAIAAWPLDEGAGGTVTDIIAANVGNLQGSVSWSTTENNLLSQRYARIDFVVDRSTFTMGRFVISRTLEPITPYGTAMPTPLGTPPKIQVSWPMRITKEQFEEIGYALTLDRGNSPNVLRSWGHDIQLIDGGKTVVSINNINAPQPWQIHQQTVYGYVSALDEIRTMNTGLIEANLTVSGM